MKTVDFAEVAVGDHFWCVHPGSEGPPERFLKAAFDGKSQFTLCARGKPIKNEYALGVNERGTIIVVAMDSEFKVEVEA